MLNGCSRGVSRARAKAPARRGATLVLAATLGLALAAMLVPSTVAAAHRTAPPRAAVLEAQGLFRELGYPLGNERAGHFGVRTRGALSYFQRKYGLPVTGYPDARTLAEMRAVAGSLRGGAGAAKSPPHDLVERTIGTRVAILSIAVGLACLLALLALAARWRERRAQGSAAAEDTAPLSAER